MSVNLRCKEVELWQTPTHITYMCYYRWKPEKLIAFQTTGRTEAVKDHWMSIREKYILWVEYISQDAFANAGRANYNGSIPTAEEITERQEKILDARDRHLSQLRMHAKLNFSFT